MSIQDNLKISYHEKQEKFHDEMSKYHTLSAFYADEAGQKSGSNSHTYAAAAHKEAAETHLAAKKVILNGGNEIFRYQSANKAKGYSGVAHGRSESAYEKW